jgi:signal transduction histidine kinase
VDRRQGVWAGTGDNGLLQLQDGMFRAAPGAELLGREVSAIYQDRQGLLWVGTDTGLGCWNEKDWKVYTISNGLPANAVRAIAEDAQGNVWFGTVDGGLCRLREGRFTSFTKTNGLPSDHIFSLCEDEEGVLWAGTAGGLGRFEAGKWRSYGKTEGLPNTSLSYLLDDGLGNLWIGSTAGLMRANKKDLAAETKPIAFRSYGQADGLPASECTSGCQPGACRTGEGILWFSTTRGLASIDPSKLRPNTNPPPVLIESIRIDEQLQTSDSLRAPPPGKLTVPAGAESLEIGFTSLNLSAPYSGRFKYRLDPFESAWIERPGDVRFVRYTRIPPGDYTFQVTACNEDFVWNDHPATLAVKVLPPFWRTWWFLSLASVCFLGAIVGSVHYVSTQKLHRQLEHLRQQEALERERARIARDLHDQLGANLTQVSLLGEMAESDKDQPAEVEAHARQISQTAVETTRALDEIVWTVNPSNDTLDGLITYLCKYAQEYLALAGLRYRLEVPPQLPNTPISPELRHNVFLAAKECVNNVVKHAHATSAWLRLWLEPDRFVLEIEDNGRGLSPDAEKKGRSGLRNMRKRLEDIGGTFEVGPGAEGGTRVRLTAPVQKSGTK